MTNEEIAIAIQNGNTDQICQLWEQCKGFIYQQAFKWSQAFKDRADFDTEDLIQSGYFALCEAVNGFQTGRGSFLYFLSLHLKTQFSEVVGCRTAAQMKDPSYNAVSLDAPAFNDGESEATIADTIPTNETGFEAVEDAVYQRQISELLREAVDSIPAQQSEGISLYYLQGKPQRETAECLHVSPARAQQVIKEGLKSLRKSAHIPTLAEAYYSERNFYLCTGFSSWKYGGMSAPERAVIDKERLEREYKAAAWGGKVSLLLKHFSYPIEKAQIIATLDSLTA